MSQYIIDARIQDFLNDLLNKGQRSCMEFGLYDPSATPAVLQYSIHFRNDSILRPAEYVPEVVDILNAAGITEPLPIFTGEEVHYYTLDNGNWVRVPDGTFGSNKKCFYVTYTIAELHREY